MLHLRGSSGNSNNASISDTIACFFHSCGYEVGLTDIQINDVAH